MKGSNTHCGAAMVLGSSFMKNLVLVVSGALGLIVSSPVVAAPADAVATMSDAQSVPELKMGETIRTSDGKQLGKVDYIVSDRAGKPVSARVIYDGRFVSVPVSSMVRAGKGVTTSLTLAAIRSTK
jgi:uncharacterized protein YrrD